MNEIFLHQYASSYGMTETHGHSSTTFTTTWGALRSLVNAHNGSRMAPEYVQIYNSPLFEVVMTVGSGENTNTFTAYSQRLALDLGNSQSADSIPITIVFDRIITRSNAGAQGQTQAPIKAPATKPTVEGFRHGCDPNNVFYYLLLFVLIMLGLFILYYLGCAAAGAIKDKKY